MKIAVVTDPCYFTSGVQTYVVNLVEHLLGMHEQIFLIHSKQPMSNLFPHAKEITSPSLYRSTAAALSLFDIHRPVSLRRYSFDVVHYTHNHVPVNFWATRSKVIVTIHGVAPLSHSEFASVPSRMLWRISALMSRHVDAVITDSNYAKEAIIQFLGVNPAKIRVIYHGVAKDFQPLQRADEARARLALKYGIKPPFILNVNGYSPIKNLVAVVRAFRDIKKLGLRHQLVLVGKPIGQSHQAARIIEEAGLENEVIITGYIPKEDLIACYSIADLFVIASFKESFGLPLLEAFGCGAPAIASNVTALPEIGGDAAMFFDPLDYEELADKMREILTNNDLRLRLRSRALERAQSFSWAKCAQDHFAVYEEVHHM